MDNTVSEKTQQKSGNFKLNFVNTYNIYTYKYSNVHFSGFNYIAVGIKKNQGDSNKLQVGIEPVKCV